jgi:hypothetical protein
MKILELALLAFGPFTDVVLDPWLSLRLRGTSAFSPPAVPFLMAGVYALSKEYFFLAWRLVDSAAVSLAAGTATVLARRMAGVTAAVAVLVLSCLDFCFRRSLRNASELGMGRTRELT